MKYSSITQMCESASKKSILHNCYFQYFTTNFFTWELGLNFESFDISHSNCWGKVLGSVIKFTDGLFLNEHFICLMTTYLSTH